MIPQKMIIRQLWEVSGYYHFKKQKSYIQSVDGPDKVLVIGYGINDLHNIYISKDRNIDVYVNLLENWALQAKIYFLTVGPVDEAKAIKTQYPVYEAHVQAFNTYMKEHEGKYEIIDLYAYLKENGYTTWPDGIHYDENTSRKIYNYIKEYISNDID